MEHIATYFLWFMLYSVCGWVWESGLYTVTQRHFVNRGFLNGPYCPIYGVGAVVDIALLGWIQNPFMLFVAAALLASVIEYATSYAMEYYFHARWWDYSEKPLNLNGRICLEGAVVFGLFGVVLIKVVQPRVAAFTNGIATQVIMVSAGVLAVAFLFDLVYTVAKINSLRAKVAQLHEVVLERFDAELQRVKFELGAQEERVRLQLNAQEKRMMKAFPAFKTTLPSLTLKGKERHSLLKLWRPQKFTLGELLGKERSRFKH